MVKNYCANCKRYTNSKVKFQCSARDDDEGFGWEEVFKVVECMGCESLCFRYEYTDDSMVNVEKDNNYYNYYEITNFPLRLERGYTPLTYSHLLPPRIRTVYIETIEAFKVKSYLLTAVGFRTIIEAICMENDIKGGSLEAKIKNLSKNKLITEKEERRLHSIRFLGNDSVHEMVVPAPTKLFIVLDIVEHLLRNLYIIDNIPNELDTVVHTFDDFKGLVFQNVRTLEEGQEKNIREILGKHVRRVGAHLPQMEAELINEIQSGSSDILKLGKIVDMGGQKVQFYLRGDNPEFDIPEGDF